MSKAKPGARSRAIAARCVDQVITHGRSLDAVFEDELGALQDERDQAFVRAQAYGAIRLQLRNAAIIGRLVNKSLKSKDSVLQALLSVGLFALQDSERPDYAVVSATVSAADVLGYARQRGFINAVLRRFIRERDAVMAAVLADEEAALLHPQWLTDRFRADWPDRWEAVVAANNERPPMWLRVNSRRGNAAEYAARLAAAEITVSTAPDYAADALLLARPQPVSALPDFNSGSCSVQDIASQLVAGVLAPEPGQRVLDACAAPGGKSCHVLERFPDVGELVLVDRSAARLERVHANLNRLQLHATVIAGDALEPSAWWDGKLFDRVLLDAPCSATGVIRRHPDIRLLRRPDDIAALAATQLQMLQALWPLVRPGGRLLYTTCSILREENEAVLADFLQDCAAARELPLPAMSLPGERVAVTHGMQLLPGEFDNDGFYYALLEKIA